MTVTVVRLGADAAPAMVAAAKDLLGEYRAFVAAAAGPGFRMPRLDAEIAGLPASHCDSGSALLVAFVAGAAAGCLALRPLGPDAELKRMWVRASARGRGVGRALVAAAIARAVADRRAALHLDTEPARMAAAVRLYRRMGFVPVPAGERAEPGLAFFRLDLSMVR